jgi:replicative DNA helicase
MSATGSRSRSMSQIAAVARRLRRRYGLALVVIDYLQLIEPDNARDPRQEQVAKIVRRLKAMARELKVPVLCLAQLNRQAEQPRFAFGFQSAAGTPRAVIRVADLLAGADGEFQGIKTSLEWLV